MLAVVPVHDNNASWSDPTDYHCTGASIHRCSRNVLPSIVADFKLTALRTSAPEVSGESRPAPNRIPSASDTSANPKHRRILVSIRQLIQER